MDKLTPETWSPKRVPDGKIKVKGLSVTCVETSSRPDEGKSALCFDKTSGTLMVEITPLYTAGRIADKTCFFADYQNFGDRSVARSYACDEDRHPRIQAKVVELVADPAPDPGLFAPPEAAKELVNCLTAIKHPTLERSTEPVPPDFSRRSLVALRVVVGTNGKPHDVEVTSAPNPGFDQPALKAVRQWTFKPATCDGQPMDTEIAVETDF